MRREQFTTVLADIGWVDEGGDPAQPTLRIVYDGETEQLRSQLRTPDGETLTGDETDVTVRLQDDGDDDAAGVIALTNRFTGEYVLEAKAPAEELLAFTRAARRYGERTDEPATYRVVIDADGDTLITYEKRALLVYGSDGELLRNQSLIPSGVEL